VSPRCRISQALWAECTSLSRSARHVRLGTLGALSYRLQGRSEHVPGHVGNDLITGVCILGDHWPSWVWRGVGSAINKGLPPDHPLCVTRLGRTCLGWPGTLSRLFLAVFARFFGLAISWGLGAHASNGGSERALWVLPGRPYGSGSVGLPVSPRFAQ